MDAFSSDAEAVLSRSIAPAASDGLTLAQLDIEPTARHIARGYTRVALQFPDELLTHAPAVLWALERALGEITPDATDASARAPTDAPASSSSAPTAELFVLADTSFDGYQVDYVAAQHLCADLIVHYGPVDLESEGPIDVRFVFGARPISVPHLARAYAATFTPDARVLVVFAHAWAHAATDLAAALKDTGALVCTAETERRAKPATKADAPHEPPPPAAPPAAPPPEPASPRSDLGAISDLAIAGEGACARLLGRLLPTPLSADELRECSLLYVGAEDQTLTNLTLILPNSSMYAYDPADADTTTADHADGGMGADEGADASARGDGAAVTDGGGAIDDTSVSRLRSVDLGTSRRLMRRYYLVNVAKEAATVGVLIGTLSAARRGQVRAFTRMPGWPFTGGGCAGSSAL